MTATSTYPRTTSPDRTPFVYIVGWSEEGVYYIGSRTRKGCHPTDIGTTYFTSSKVVRAKWAETPPDIIQVLMTFATKKAAIEFEHTALSNLEAHKSPQLLNRGVGGKKFVLTAHTLEARAKMSAAHKGKPKHYSVWNKGKTMPPETRAKISAANKGNPAPNKGIAPSQETRAKISANNKSRTQEVKDKISATLRAKNLTPWNKGKASPYKGKKRSDETRAKMRAARARRKAAATSSTLESLTNTVLHKEAK